ncbi:MAG: choice-of-anchor E domain-containing protein [Methanothrix sp.]|nr:choice-of-anchor E domain-containing protein [Methanothrix sp.]
MTIGFKSIWAILANLKRSDGERLHSLSLLLVIVTIFSISGLSMGENLEYCYDHPLSVADWSDNVTLPKFDPSFGELMGAKIRINYILAHDLNFSNTRDNPENITINVLGNLSLTLPDKTSLVVESKKNRTLLLNPKQDMALNESSNESQTFVLHHHEGFIGSSSADTVLLPVAANAFSSVQSSGVITGVVPRAGASICIMYEFIPARGEEINNSGTRNPIIA